MKQTAVEWLKVTVKAMIENGEDADLYAVLWHIEQAKQMEKEQMIDWYATGQADTVNMYEQHLNKTSNTNEK
jgi:hypothetical protein